MSDTSKVLTLYKPKSEVEFSIVSSLLEEAQIPFMVRNSEVQDLFGVGRIGTGYNFVTGPMIILVDENDLTSARDIINDIIEPNQQDSKIDQDFDLESTFNIYLNMSIVLGIIFPSLGIYHLTKAFIIKIKNTEELKGNIKLSISSVIFITGLILWILIILNKYFIN